MSHPAGPVESGAERPEGDRHRLARLSRAISDLSRARTAEAVIELVRRAARELSGASGVSVVVREGGLCRYVAEDSAFSLWTGQTFPLEVCISGQAMISGSQIVIPDIYADDRVPHENYRPTPIRSLLITPVGQPEAHTALGAYWERLEGPGPFDAVIIEALAASMATALENLELVSSLQEHARQSERLYAGLEKQWREQAEAQKQIAFQADLLDMVQSAVIATDLGGTITFWNRAAETLYGWTVPEALGRPIMGLNVAAESYAQAAEILDSLESGETWSGDIVLRRKDATTFRARVTNSPILDDNGVLVGIVGVSSDVTAEHAADKRQELLLHELTHRVKNTLTIIQSLSRQSFKDGEDLHESRLKFEGRIQALAAAHTLLTRSAWQSISVSELVGLSLQPFVGEASPHRLSLLGPEMRVRSSQAVALALALHELATNAVKYGALSVPEGQVEIRWWLQRSVHGARLKMLWAELGGPPVQPPRARGFGSRLLERALAMELGGSVRVAFEPTGVICSIDAPAPYDETIADEPEEGQLVFPHLA